MHSKEPYQSETLALAFANGDERAFDWFFQQFYRALSLFSFKILNDRAAAEEIASDAFVKTWNHRAQFTSVTSIRAYLYTVVRNDSTRYLRLKERRLVSEKIALLASPEPLKNSLQAIIEAESLRQLHSSIELLPPACAKVFRLLYVEGMSVSETATILNISPSTVKTQKLRGLVFLKGKPSHSS